MLRVRFVAPPGLALGYSVERLRDGLFYDFRPDVRAFVAAPIQPIVSIGEGPGTLMGLYSDELDLTAKAAPDGRYAVYVRDEFGTVVGATQVTLRGGDDEPVPITSPMGGGIEIRFVRASQP